MDSNTPTPAQAQRLARVLLDRPAPAACAACLDTLEAYVDGQLAGQPAAALFPRVAAHLDACVDCSIAYAMLYDLRLQGANLPEPPAIPAPDLGFLPGARPSLAQAARAALSAQGGRLRLAFSHVLLELAAPASPALAMRGGAPAPVFEITIEAPAPGVEQLQVIGYAQPDGLVSVRVRLRLPGRDWPDLAGAEVSLALEHSRRQALTDAWGEAVFENVAQAEVAGMRLEVAPPISA